MGSKGSSAVTVPNYQPIATASLQAATMQNATQQQQLAQAQSEYNQTEPYVQSYLGSMTANSNAQTADASAAQSEYNSVYKPIEGQFAQQASNYNSPSQANQAAGQAEGDVASQYDAARSSSLSSLESYGIDPSQTRFGALDLGTRVSQAAATAAAGTSSRINSQMEGMSLENTAINTGRGYSSAITNDYGGAASSGASGINASNNTASTYGALEDNTNYGSLANQSLGTSSSAMNSQFSNEATYGNMLDTENAQTMQGIGSAVGGALSMAAMF